MPGLVRLVDPDGREREVPVEGAGQLLQDPRWRLSTADDTVDRLSQQAKEADFGGAAGTAKAIGAGLARGATLGLSDVAARAIGGEDTGIELEGLREVNPGVSFASEFAGALAPTLLSGGSGAAAYLPSSLAARAGAGAARLAGGGLRGALAAGAVEGALYGAGEGLTQTALSDDPLDLERAASTIGINTLVGAGVGAGASGLTHGVARGLSEAKGALDGWLDKQAAARAARQIPPGSIDASTDVTLLDRKGLKIAREKEIAALEDARIPERTQIADELVEYRDQMHSAEMFDVHHGVDDGEVREFGGSLKRGDRELRGLLDRKFGVVRDPGRALDVLKHQEQAMGDLLDWGQSMISLRRDSQRAADALRREITAGRVAGYNPSALTPKGLDNAIDLEVSRAGYRPPGEFPKGADVVVEEFPAALERNRALQERIQRSMASPTSPRLRAIDDAQEALLAPQSSKHSAASDVLEAVAPFAGPVGALASGTRAIAKLRNAAGVVAEKSGKAVSRFLGAAAPAVEAAEKYVPPVATKVLAAVRFSDRKRDDEPDDLAGLYAARSKELRELTEYAPDGSVQMRPAQRIKMADKLDGIRAVDPITADRIETKAAAKIEWLSKQLPRRPDIGGAGIGPDNWRPSDLEMRSWARKVHAADDPLGVFERALHGAVTPEDVQAMTAVHPEMLRDWGAQVSTQLPALRKRLSHQKRLALSMLTGIPVEPAMHPQVLAVLQDQFTDEPGSEGGTQAPRAQPQFGSVSKSIEVATPAQARQEQHT